MRVDKRPDKRATTSQYRGHQASRRCHMCSKQGTILLELVMDEEVQHQTEENMNYFTLFCKKSADQIIFLKIRR